MSDTIDFSDLAEPTDRVRLRWRSRRGLLENDIIITRFLDQHETTLSDADVVALAKLLDLSDGELLDYLLSRKPLPDELADDTNVSSMLKRLQSV